MFQSLEVVKSQESAYGKSRLNGGFFYLPYADFPFIITR